MHQDANGEDCYCDELGFHPCVNATAGNLDPSPCAPGISATSVSELNFKILREPPYEIRRYLETPNRMRVVMGENLCIWSYTVDVVTLPKKPPKPPKDYPVMKILARRSVERV